MSKERTLYGRKIVPHHMLTFAEQIYDILVAEIELGRWKVNERLPGVIHLAKELAFGTKTVQAAYDRLKQDGYVRSLGYRGTYLKSQHPLSPSTQGKIGVLVAEEQAGQPLVLWYEHVILQCARRKGLVTDVRTFDSAAGAVRAVERGFLFGADVTGIISLTPFRMPVRFGDGRRELPLVFLCPPYERCAPKVCADVREAYYDLTMRFIRYGHRNIVFSEDAVEPDPRQTDMHREGYLEAMREEGLPVNTDVIKASRRVKNPNLGSVADHLKDLLSMPKATRPTAIVSGSLGRSMVLTHVAPLVDVQIPRDVSVASIGSAFIEGEQGRQITGMLPDFDKMIELCFLLLEQQRQTGRSEYTKVHVRMHFVEGHTIRALGPTPPKAGAEQPMNLRHDLRSLSGALQA